MTLTFFITSLYIYSALAVVSCIWRIGQEVAVFWQTSAHIWHKKLSVLKISVLLLNLSKMVHFPFSSFNRKFSDKKKFIKVENLWGCGAIAPPLFLMSSFKHVWGVWSNRAADFREPLFLTLNILYELTCLFERLLQPYDVFSRGLLYSIPTSAIPTASAGHGRAVCAVRIATAKQLTMTSAVALRITSRPTSSSGLLSRPSRAAVGNFCLGNFCRCVHYVRLIYILP